MKFYEIAFQRKIGPDKETLSYHSNKILIPGQSVKVPLKKQTIFGIVWKEIKEPSYKTLSINELINEKPLLSKAQLELLNWMSEYYLTPIHKILKLFIPKRVFENREIRQKKLAEKVIKQERTKKLNSSQEEVLSTILGSPKNKFLIHGITGSGKTEVYTKLAKHFINQDKQALILVPEISLTPQTIEYFEQGLKIPAGVIHSKLSEGEKNQTWKKIHSGETKLIIGSRSAIFSPFQNLGICIIDEEHENSYKQDQAPRYHCIKIAEKMQEINPQIKVILGSATPSIESKHQLSDNTLELKERFGNSKLPSIEIVDLREEFKKQNHSIFSERLKEEIEASLKKNEQIILFLNRRGSASSVVCRDCGCKATCPHCETTLTFHEKTLQRASLICHHCGYIGSPPTLCPICKGHNIRYLGIGTQKIEQEVHKEFPTAKTLRADKDSTSSKHGFEEIYKKFRGHQADILIGTQMIAKGLNLPKVNLVGVILADIGLNIPDFRSAERNFQLMTQVAGRSGRTSENGKVIIQTYDPQNIALTHTQNYNYEDFYQLEITQRKLFQYPPFSQLAKFIIQNKSLSKAKENCEELEGKFWQIAREENCGEEIEINFYPAYLSKLKGNYRYILLIKDKSNTGLIHKILGKIEKKYIIDPDIKIDIDPININ